jgi:hypothetical protein
VTGLSNGSPVDQQFIPAVTGLQIRPPRHRTSQSDSVIDRATSRPTISNSCIINNVEAYLTFHQSLKTRIEGNM